MPPLWPSSPWPGSMRSSLGSRSPESWSGCVVGTDRSCRDRQFGPSRWKVSVSVDPSGLIQLLLFTPSAPASGWAKGHFVVARFCRVTGPLSPTLAGTTESSSPASMTRGLLSPSDRSVLTSPGRRPVRDGPGSPPGSSGDGSATAAHGEGHALAMGPGGRLLCRTCRSFVGASLIGQKVGEGRRFWPRSPSFCCWPPPAR